MVRVAGAAAVAPLGRAVQDSRAMLAVSWLAAEASQGERQGGRKLASLSMDERSGRDDSLQPRPAAGARVPLPPGLTGTLHAGRERPSGAAALKGRSARNGGSLTPRFVVLTRVGRRLRAPPVRRRCTSRKIRNRARCGTCAGQSVDLTPPSVAAAE